MGQLTLNLLVPNPHLAGFYGDKVKKQSYESFGGPQMLFCIVLDAVFDGDNAQFVRHLLHQVLPQTSDVVAVGISPLIVRPVCKLLHQTVSLCNFQED